MIEKKSNKKFVDDGRTIYNMDIDGMPGRRRQRKTEFDISAEEKKTLIKAAFGQYLPIFISILICFGLAAILISVWLH